MIIPLGLMGLMGLVGQIGRRSRNVLASSQPLLSDAIVIADGAANCDVRRQFARVVHSQTLDRCH